MTRCPKCRAVVVYNAGGKLKVRTTMLALTESGAEVVCPRCHADVPLDLHLGEELLRALQGSDPPLVLRDAPKVG